MGELQTREQRAQTGVLQFAEEMQAIRDHKLYPNAGKRRDAWKTYCKERWGQSESTVHQLIQARAVLERRAELGESPTSVTKARTVATLPEEVQDAILEDEPKEQVVKARAKAARQVQKKAERKGVEPDAEEMTQAALSAKPPKPAPKVEVPEELRDENLPPKLEPADHGSPTRTLTGNALHTLWRANEKLKDEAMGGDDREAEEVKLEKLIDLARHMLAVIRGETTVSDDDLASLLENANG